MGGCRRLGHQELEPCASWSTIPARACQDCHALGSELFAFMMASSKPALSALVLSGSISYPLSSQLIP